MTSAAVPVIVITGTMGSGKTTVLGEASDVLTGHGIAHAAIDLDTLAIAHLPGANTGDLAYRNLASVWQNYAAAGAERLLIAAAVESATDLARIRDAVPGATVLVCRLTASSPTMQERVARRDPGLLQDQFVARVTVLETLLDRVGLEHFALCNDDDCSVTEVARQLLALAGWVGHR